MGFIYSERTILIIDRSNRDDINDLINKLIVELQKLIKNAHTTEFQADRDHAYTIIDLPFEG